MEVLHTTLPKLIVSLTMKNKTIPEVTDDYITTKLDIPGMPGEGSEVADDDVRTTVVVSRILEYKTHVITKI